MTRKLEHWTGWLLVFLALGAFILSFAGMYSVAVDAGYGWLAWLWPLVTESAVVIFSLILLVAKLDGYDNRYLHPMIVGCTALSVTFNVLHAPSNDLLTRAVVALPPIFLYAAFKTWIWKVEQDTKRAGEVARLDNLTSQCHQMTRERDTLLGQIEALGNKRDSLQGDISRSSPGNVQEMTAKRQAEADNRKRQALAMSAEGMTRGDIAEALGVTPRTVKRYLNGHGGTQ